MTDLQLTALMEWAKAEIRLEMCATFKAYCGVGAVPMAEQDEASTRRNLFHQFGMEEGPLGWPVKREAS